jgi:DNA-directed RNA polymerase specialized sigma24 family protein
MASQCAGTRPSAAKRPQIPYDPPAPIRRAQGSHSADRVSLSDSPPWKKLKRFVRRGLTTKERLLITLRYCENLTMAEIGAVLEMPEARVVELHQNVLERVKTWVLGRKKNRARVA